MAENGEDKTSRGWFDRLKHLLWPAEQAPPPAARTQEAPPAAAPRATAPLPAPQAHTPEAPPAPPKDHPKLDRLLAALERQTAQIDALLQQVRISAARGGERPGADIMPIPSGGPMEDALKSVAQRSEEMAHELQSLVENSERQIDLLQKMQIDLASAAGIEGEKSGAMSRMSGAIENLSRNIAAQAGMLDQVRDRLAGANTDLAKAVASQGRRLAWLMVVAILLVAALAVMAAMSAGRL